MSEVKGTTSQGSVLSGVNQKSSGADFDMRSWQGLTGLLQAAREAHMDDTAYAAFRDIVLSYAQSGGDPALKSRIDAVVKTLRKTEEGTTQVPTEIQVITEPPAQKQRSGTQNETKIIPETKSTQPPVAPKEIVQRGGVRPTPVFGGVPTKPDTEVSISHLDEIDVSLTQEREVRLENPPDPMLVFIPELPKESEPEAKPIEVAVPQAEVTPSPITERPPMKTVEEYKARITEIKRIVHNEIGNPVTLMDAGNQLGRTYMNALLTAMKASGGSSPVGIDNAMQKLEEAFTQIQALGKKKPSPEAGSTTPEPVPAMPPQEATAPPIVPVEPLVSPKSELKPVPEPTLEAIPITENEIPVPEEIPAVVVEAPVMEVAPVLPKVGELVVPEVVRHEVSESVSIPRQESPVNLPVLEHHEEANIHRKAIPELDPPQSAISEVMFKHVASLGKEILPNPINTVHEIKDVVRDFELIDLESDEVTAALYQLLHEWSIFSSSGIFGTGPAGYDHPLYKQLEHLPMLTVANGGWDDAQPKHHQSIKDYINAWRHEQSISFSPTETFEHYLRRVVQRVLKRQKGR